MARKRRTSQILETARQRLAGLKSIDPAPNFGTALTVTEYGTKITDFDAQLGTYNQHVAALDDEQNTIDAQEEDLRDWNRRILSAAEATYGPDSSEYELAGGTRTSERKSPKPKAPGTPPSA